MELKDYLEILFKRKWIVISTLAATLAVVLLLSNMAVPIYSSSTLVRVAQIEDEPVNSGSLSYSERLMNTYVYLLKSTPYMQKTIEQLDLNTSPDQLEQAIEVAVLPSTELLRITVENVNPNLAMEIANTLGQLLIDEREEFYTGPGKSSLEILDGQIQSTEQKIAEDRSLLQSLLSRRSSAANVTTIQELNTRIRVSEQTLTSLLSDYDQARVVDIARANSVSIVQPAELPDRPIKPDLRQNVMVGFLGGLIGGIGLAFLYQHLNQTIDSPSAIQDATDAPLIGCIPKLRGPRLFRNEAFLLDPKNHDPGQLAFESLGISVRNLQCDSSPCTILVTSAEPGAGKSTVLANLSTALADHDSPVLLVDSDLRRPAMHRVFDLSSSPGLADLIAEPALIRNSLQLSNNPYLKVLACGHSAKDPAQLMKELRTKEILQELGEETSIILLDSPPLLGAVDARILAGMADLVLVIVREGQTELKDLSAAVSQLDGIGSAKTAIVMNGATDRRSAYYYRYRSDE